MLNETLHAGGFIVSEGNNTYSRERAVLAAAQTALAGQVLGRITAALEAASAVKAGGNTGTGALTLDVATPVLVGAKLGVYTVRCTAAASGSGTFTVQDPDGFSLGTVAVGGTFANDVKFVIADGDPDFAVGDGFDITVSEDDDATNIGRFAILDPAATNGTQKAAALLYGDATTAADETAEIVIIARQAEVDGDALVWPEGISPENKAAAIERLSTLGIITR